MADQRRRYIWSKVERQAEVARNLYRPHWHFDDLLHDITTVVLCHDINWNPSHNSMTEEFSQGGFEVRNNRATVVFSLVIKH